MKAKQKQDNNKLNNTNVPQKKHRLGTVSKAILPDGSNQFHRTPTSPLVLICLRCSNKQSNISFGLIGLVSLSKSLTNV